MEFPVRAVLVDFYFGSHSGTPAISTLSESYSGPYWWPQKDTPADKADSSDVWITVASNLTPVSNGTLKECIDNGNGTHTYHWKEPICNCGLSYLACNYVIIHSTILIIITVQLIQ